MSPDTVIYFILLLVLVAGLYFLWKRQHSSSSSMLRNNQPVSLNVLRRCSEDDIAELVTTLFQSKGFQVQKTSGDFLAMADYLLEKEGARGFVSTRHWHSEKVGVGQISQEVIGMNQQNSTQNYILTTGKFEKGADEMANYNRNLFLVNGSQLKAMIANAKLSS